MATLATTLKEEIKRLARKEIRAQTSSTKKAVVQYRQDIVLLKRKLREQEKQIARLAAGGKVKPSREASATSEPPEGVRFSARSLKAQRARLGISAKDYGKLVGVSPLTIYNWENGKTKPRKAQLASLVAIRGIGKREAATRLELLASSE